MTLSTSALRTAWAPACQPKGTVYLDAYRALDAVLKAHGYGPRPTDTGAYNCRKITGGTGYSLHAYGPGDRFTFWTGVTISTSLAVDINWQTNPYGPRLVTDMPRAMVDAVLRIRTRNGQQVWRWGGDYSTNKDAMHFEIVCDPRDLGTGIDPTTVAGSQPAPQPKDWTDMATEAELRRIIGEELDRRINPDGKGNLLVRIRDSVAATEKRVKDLVTGKRPGKG